jgi:hypothetical protein
MARIMDMGESRGQDREGRAERLRHDTAFRRAPCRSDYAIQATRNPPPWICGDPEIAG